jgi:hypothetical protein
MTTRASLLAALCALAVLTGCGDDDGPPSSQQPVTTETTPVETTPGTAGSAAGPTTTLEPEDKRGHALACIRDEKGMDARAVGDKGIEIDGADGPRVDFYQSSLEAEGEQFEGRAEGAEQIGAALLYVRETPEDQLVAIEDCLNDQ